MFENVCVSANGSEMTNRNARDRALIHQLMQLTGKTASQIAREAGLAASTLTRVMASDSAYGLSVPTLEKLQAKYPSVFGDISDVSEAAVSAYVEIEVLPSYAGMGGGGYGEGEPGRALLPRALIEERLHGRPEDFIVIDVRGDSMRPIFEHGDQVVADRRDTNPTQPGPFALFDGDAYVVKLVERIHGKRGWLRVFSANDAYREYEVMEEETRVLGRPVWVGRAL